LMQFI